MTFKSFFLSWDFVLSFIIGLLSYYYINEVVPFTILKDLYLMSISVLSILFGMFFAALALIISVNDVDFIEFLEEENAFTSLLNQFKFSLSSIFFTLIISIILYIIAIIQSSDPFSGQIKLQLSFFVMLFMYSITAVFLSAVDALMYIKYRVKFLKYKNK